jgi:hypothetical protein
MGQLLRAFRDALDRIYLHVASCDVHVLTLRYFPAVFGIGILLGALATFVSALLGMLVVLAGGIALGYAIRAYMSYQRRLRAMRERF